MELYKKTAGELSRMLKAKEISSVELTNVLYNRIDEVEPKIDSYITLTKEQALNKAQEVDKKISKGEELNPLAGIPIGIKDNICTKDIKTTCASKMLSNFIPPYNATVIEKINENDLVITGKLNLDEFAMGSSCENSAFKKTKNPHDLSRVSGGSSGGPAASVACGASVIALGTDTGGSIRQPASYCGIVGLKPTYGAVSRYGLIAFASSLDQIGPMARSVEDIALLSDIIYSKDQRDSTNANTEITNFASDLNGNVKGLKIGLPKEYFGEGVNSEVKEKVLAAAKQYEKMGATLEETSLSLLPYALPTYYIISSAEAASNLARFDGIKYGYRADAVKDLNELYIKTRTEGFGDEVKRRIILGTYVLSSGYYDAYYKKAQAVQRAIKHEFSRAFEKFDILLTPTTPNTAFKIGEKVTDPAQMYLEDICTVSVNISGNPAIGLPCGKNKDGLPIGLQLIGKKFSDKLLVNTAFAYERESGINTDMFPII